MTITDMTISDTNWHNQLRYLTVADRIETEIANQLYAAGVKHRHLGMIQIYRKDCDLQDAELDSIVVSAWDEFDYVEIVCPESENYKVIRIPYNDPDLFNKVVAFSKDFHESI